MALFKKQEGENLVAVTKQDLTSLILFAVTGARVSFTERDLVDLRNAITVFRRYLAFMLPQARNSMLGAIRVSAQMDLASAGREDSYTDPEVSKAWLEFANTDLSTEPTKHL